MNTEAVKELIAACRSGEYKQGRGQLRDKHDCYCIQGLMCEVYRQRTGKGVWEQRSCGDYEFRLNADSMAFTGSAPFDVPYYFELSASVAGDLMYSNDKGKSLEELATEIESLVTT